MEARSALESALLRVDARTEAGAKAASRIWSDLGVLKRSSVLASARVGKPALLERQAFQRMVADFQPGERKTTLGLATGHLILSLLRVKLALAIATVLCEQLAAALPPADGGRERLRRAGLVGSAQRLAYYCALLALGTTIPQLSWYVRVYRGTLCRDARARAHARIASRPQREIVHAPVRGQRPRGRLRGRKPREAFLPFPCARHAHTSCCRVLLASALVAEPDPMLPGVLPESLVPLVARRRWAHGALGSVRELLRVLRPLAQCAEVALLLLGWYSAFAGT